METVPDVIKEIITAAAAAPSGDNSQPWEFTYRAPNQIEFHFIAGVDNELLNIDNSGTLIALGAAIENAVITARSLGYSVFIKEAEDTHIATLTIKKSSSEASILDTELSKAILQRHSNRKPYIKEQLKAEDRNALIVAASENSQDILCTLVEDSDLLHALGRDMTVMEEIALSNEHLHKFFFSGIFWPHSHNEEGQPGLYIKTLELPPPAQLLFRGLRHWSFAKTLGKVGFPKQVAEMNAKQNASASGYIFINVKEFNRASYIQAGRILERIWLTATKQGMSAQIVTGILFLARRIERGDKNELFSDEHQEKALRAYTNMKKVAQEGYEPLLALRIGYADPATSRSKRKAPKINTV